MDAPGVTAVAMESAAPTASNESSDNYLGENYPISVGLDYLLQHSFSQEQLNYVSFLIKVKI